MTNSQEELETQVCESRGMIYNLCASKLRKIPGREAVAEELTQIVLLKAIRALPSFRGEAAVKSWLYRIATNECMSFLRSEAVRLRRNKSLEEFEFENEDGYDATYTFEPFVLNHTEEHYLNRITAKRLWAKLNPQERKLLLLHLAGCQNVEIAANCRMPLGTMKSKLNRLRTRLKNEFPTLRSF